MLLVSVFNTCIVVICSFTIIVRGHNGSNRMEEVYRWKQMAFTEMGNGDLLFPEDIPQKSRSSNQTLSNYNSVPLGATHHNGRLFIAVPRRSPDIPATLTTISTKEPNGSSPNLNPYPSREINELTTNSRSDHKNIVSVYRSRVDAACNRLWFIDTGLLEYPNNFTQVQRPSIWVIDLETDQLIRRFEIPQSIVAVGNGLISITVDSDRQHCDEAFAYIPDMATYRLYTYDFKNDRIWSFRHNYFHIDPFQGDFSIGGQHFQWSDGIFSVALSRRHTDGFRTAYFHAMSSITEFSVSTRVLRNETASKRTNHGHDFVYLGVRGEHSQSSMHDYDPHSGVIFYSQIATNGVSCWDTNKPFSDRKHAIIDRNDETMIYPSDLNIDSEGTLWMLTNSIPIFVFSKLNTNSINYRIWKIRTRDAVLGTVCQRNDRWR